MQQLPAPSLVRSLQRRTQPPPARQHASILAHERTSALTRTQPPTTCMLARCSDAHSRYNRASMLAHSHAGSHYQHTSMLARCSDASSRHQHARSHTHSNYQYARDLKTQEDVVLGWGWDDGAVVHELPVLVRKLASGAHEGKSFAEEKI